MNHTSLQRRVLVFIAGFAVAAVSGWASADPPSRVARLGYISGDLSFSPAGENDWVQARINRPLTTGDRLWAESRARAEIQIGGTVIRMNALTGVSILNLDDQIVQLQLTQGTLNVRVRRLERNQAFEVNTPNLAFTLRQPGEYRIEVDPDGNATEIQVRRGQGEAYGEGAAYVIDSRQAFRFTGIGLREYDYIAQARADDFDRWATSRDRRYDNSSSARYVSQDVVGYEDLDTNGTWRSDATWGNVWYPSRVAAGWAPYRDGHWAWIDPWGWTWIDDAPWGYAVSHYGRWTNLGGNWGWVPGPPRSRAYYAPALVAFVGGSNFQLAISSGNVGGVAWFPLAPREVYRPAYNVSRGYFENINRSNTVINTTIINNTYNNSNVTNVIYANRQVEGAVIAMPTNAFVQSQQASRSGVRVSADSLVNAPISFVPQVAPTARSVRGASPQGGQPPGRAFERSVVARTAPAPAHAGFAAQQPQLNAQPGRPLDNNSRRDLKPVAAAPAAIVNVVAPAAVAPPVALPPRVGPAGGNSGAGNGRGKAENRQGNNADSPNTAIRAPEASTNTPAASAPEQPGRPDNRGRGAPRGQSAAPPAPPTPQSAPPPAQPSEQRGRGEPRGQREPPVAPPAAVPQAVQIVPEQRARPDQRGRVEPTGQVAPPPLPPAAATPPGPQEPRAKAERRQAPVAPPAAAESKRAPLDEAHNKEPKPVGAKPKDKKKDGDEQKDEADNNKDEQGKHKK